MHYERLLILRFYILHCSAIIGAFSDDSTPCYWLFIPFLELRIFGVCSWNAWPKVSNDRTGWSIRCMVDPITEDKNIWLFFFFEFYIEFGQQKSMFYEPKIHWDFGVPNKQNRKLHD